MFQLSQPYQFDDKKPGQFASLFVTGLTLVSLLIYIGLSSTPLFWIYTEMGAAWRLPSFVVIGGLLIWTTIKKQFPVSFMQLDALALTALCATCAVLTFPLLQQLSASFALLGFYGFISTLKFCPTNIWRQKFIIAGLIALIIPFFLVPGTGAGFYLRLMTADSAAKLLALFGHGSLAAHDVLIFDNGIAQVDLPCAGLKSLFTGSAFFLVASLILKRSVTFFWCIGYGLFVMLLLIANTLRVVALIWVSEILQARSIAETIHAPLGIALFICVCLSGLFILFKINTQTSAGVAQNEKQSNKDNPKRLAILSISLMIWISILGIFAQSHWTRSGGVDYTIASPIGFELSPLPLTKIESQFFEARQKSSAKKWRFKSQGQSGYILVVRSGAANGLHAPEVCMLGNGISVDNMSTKDISNNQSKGQYRWLTVDNKQRTAVYWMQSGSTLTDDFRKRLFNYGVHGQRDWVMVTLMFDTKLNFATSTDKVTVETLIDQLNLHFNDMTGVRENDKKDT